MKLKKILALCLSAVMLLTPVRTVNAEPSGEMEQNVGENESSLEYQENQENVDKDAQKVTEEPATEESSSNAQSDVGKTDEKTNETEHTQFEKAQ